MFVLNFEKVIIFLVLYLINWNCLSYCKNIELNNSSNTLKLKQPKKRSIDAIPILSQFKSLFQAMSGDTAGARRTQENFSKQAPIYSQVRSAVEAIAGDKESAKKTQLEFLNNF